LNVRDSEPIQETFDFKHIQQHTAKLEQGKKTIS